jgi:hypothetical protein
MTCCIDCIGGNARGNSSGVRSLNSSVQLVSQQGVGLQLLQWRGGQREPTPLLTPGKPPQIALMRVSYYRHGD